MLRPLLVGDAVALVFEEAADIPPLYTDEGKVSQILRNLISNALKFTERGEVGRGRDGRRADTVTFNVRDTGIGIAGAIATIFQEFGQVATHADPGQGDRVGLPLSKKLAELLGGRSACKAPGRGSVFWVTVPRVYPRRRRTDTEAMATPAGPHPGTGHRGRPGRRHEHQRALRGSRYQPFRRATIAAARRAIEQVRGRRAPRHRAGRRGTWKLLIE